MENQTKDGTASKRLKRQVILTLALASMLLFLALVFEDIGELAAANWSELPLGLIVRYAVAMGIGGAVAGYVLAGLFGRQGITGWCLAMTAGVLVATFAGLLGSAIGLAPDLLSDGYQTRDIVAIGAGALVFPLAVIGWPVLLPVWIVLIARAHMLARRRR
ncbi:hypothetical protein [Roseobacter ponti]|uniref:Uncharacterized protein n=1 Tax=Roseobacter ponti TaxID=1891787 RepID=A0A858SWF2_9RHOB|nr:hypothetical protein [Roseobacter ponti]QJF51196.1 hypothetical protein G3256_08490 [Roseobacter ponti]